MNTQNPEEAKKILECLANGSPYRPFGFEIKNLKAEGFIEAPGYCCPKCGHEPPEIDEGYKINGEIWPQCFNEYLFSSDMGSTHDWDEAYICQKCGTKFYFRNGCF